MKDWIADRTYRDEGTPEEGFQGAHGIRGNSELINIEEELHNAWALSSKQNDGEEHYSAQ